MAADTAPLVFLVDAGWPTRKPTPDERQAERARWSGAGANVVDLDLLDRHDAASTAVCDQIGLADLIWFGGGDAAAIFDRLWATPALDAIRRRHEAGAAIGGVSAGALVWGAGTVTDYASRADEEPFPLFGWLPRLVVFPHWMPTRERSFRERVKAFPGCGGLALAHGGAVAVGAGDEIRSVRSGVTSVAHATLSEPDGPLVLM